MAFKAFWQNEELKEELLLFIIPDIEYLRSSASETGSFDKNPGWSVNGRDTIVGFNALFKDGGTVAHEFGHAFGLEHTFPEPKIKEKKKKQAEEVEENSKFYNEVEGRIKVIEMFVPNNVSSKEYLRFWSKGYREKQYAIKSFDTSWNELQNLSETEFIHKEQASVKTLNSAAIKQKDEFFLLKGQTKENFMDYLNPDVNRKTFTKEQIDSILK